eukprot:NODE_21656_length_251_cov_4.242574_g20487_i0.p4 GENE.NODE_21656_length_251_cov_4.242574_g20487_i0~~NODE_21656_length_251_cov_4.242574_g20487_i0.p4  ORF type:complete len:52 (+),score=5.25 NODE_21656_length_251_cov_4.242574_g20487_i0:2-157(+)
MHTQAPDPSQAPPGEGARAAVPWRKRAEGSQAVKQAQIWPYGQVCLPQGRV